MTSSADDREAEERLLSESVAERIRKGLAENDWSQHELARRSGVDVMQISRLLRCEIGLSAATLLMLANAFDCPTEEFMPATH